MSFPEAVNGSLVTFISIGVCQQVLHEYFYLVGTPSMSDYWFWLSNGGKLLGDKMHHVLLKTKIVERRI